MLVTFLHTRPLDYGYNASGYMSTLTWFSHQRLFLSSWPIYRMKIIRVNKEYTALKWRKYDILFFNIKWSLMNPTIYAGYSQWQPRIHPAVSCAWQSLMTRRTTANRAVLNLV